ncbi:uncharacterized protein LOC114356739 [Ostrinia furnacalis]|uniref:uncharacterized protein LOC114356739 n=1 Tax=Ostrinia furnacalis TaxID=93504 RepID=UPI00103EEA05|nr:uncharacterized protein LOC114356739 [Ostrinia furnacalis]
MNYIRILSKSSLLSSSSSNKSITPSEEVTKLQSEVEKLKQTIESLKQTVERRDAAIGTLAREKEKLYVELKTAQRTTRNLHQQLEDERDMHTKEKEFLIDEIKRIANKNESESNYNYYNQGDTIDSIIREEMRSKDEIICNICTKYLKIKESKKALLRNIKTLQSESQKVGTY